MLSRILSKKKNPVSFTIRHKHSHMIIMKITTTKTNKQKRANAFQTLLCARHYTYHSFTLIITFNSNQNPLTCGPFIVSVFLVEEINDWKNALTKVTEMITKQFKFELKSETWARAKLLINKLYLIPKKQWSHGVLTISVHRKRELPNLF